MSTLEQLKEKNRALEQRVEKLEQRFENPPVSRRAAIAGGAGILGLSALSGSASAGSNQVGTIGSSTERVDIFAEDLDVSGDITGFTGDELAFSKTAELKNITSNSVSMSVNNADITKIYVQARQNQQLDLLMRINQNTNQSDYYNTRSDGFQGTLSQFELFNSANTFGFYGLEVTLIKFRRVSDSPTSRIGISVDGSHRQNKGDVLVRGHYNQRETLSSLQFEGLETNSDEVFISVFQKSLS